MPLYFILYRVAYTIYCVELHAPPTLDPIAAVYEDGAVFSPKVLDIKMEDLLQRFMEGVGKVAALSLQIGYPTVASVPHSIVNGFKRLLAVAVATDISFPEAEQVSCTSNSLCSYYYQVEEWGSIYFWCLIVEF